MGHICLIHGTLCPDGYVYHEVSEGKEEGSLMWKKAVQNLGLLNSEGSRPFHCVHTSKRLFLGDNFINRLFKVPFHYFPVCRFSLHFYLILLGCGWVKALMDRLEKLSGITCQLPYTFFRFIVWCGI